MFPIYEIIDGRELNILYRPKYYLCWRVYCCTRKI